MNTCASRIIIALLIVAGLVGLSCKKTATVNYAPVITALDVPDSVDVSNDATFTCTASDSNGDPLAYTWTCTAGLLQSVTGSAVVWTAPDTSGTATVTVIVQDTLGASDTATGTVTVNPVSTTIIDWDGAVVGGGAEIWTINIPADYTVSGSFAADGQDITFLMLDTANYGLWRNGEPYTALVKVERSAGSDFSALVDTVATLYNFVLDNTYNAAADTSVHLFVRKVTP